MQGAMNWDTNNTLPAGLFVNVSDQAALLGDIRSRFSNRQGFTIATLNLDHTVKLRRDADFRKAYGQHSHITADGNPIVWLSRLAGQGDVSLVPGSELIEPLSALAAEEDVPVALFGATDASLQAASDALQKKYPNIEIVLCLAPPMGFEVDGAQAKDAIKQLRLSGARLVFLALGAPKQERFASFAAQALPQTGFVSIGAGLDFISGAQVRAPRWVRSLALEWVWRMLSNPRRLAARYGACIAILPRLTLRSLQSRMSPESKR